MGETQVDEAKLKAVEVVRGHAAAVAEGLGLELVEVRLGGGQKRPKLQVFVDGPDGVKLDDCVQVSRALSARLEEDDPFPGPYALEVSSPGLDRPFETPEDYRRNLGRKVDCVLKEARPGGVERLRGVLASVDDEGLVVTTDKGVDERCSFEELRKVHRTIEMNKSSGKK